MSYSDVTDSFLAAVAKAAAARGMTAETLLRAWWAESRLTPSTTGDGNHFGLNGLMGEQLAQWHIDPHEYVTRSAEGQLPVVMRDVDARIKMTGGKPFKSYYEYEAANICPFFMKHGAAPDDVFVRREDGVCYTGNAAIDRAGKGYITYGDFKTWMDVSASESGQFAKILARVPAAGKAGSGVAIAGAAALVGLALFFGRRR